MNFTTRQRFLACMRYQPHDRIPLTDFGFWNQTIQRWSGEGFPAHGNTDLYFGLDPIWFDSGLFPGLLPQFKEQVLEDLGENEKLLQYDGVIAIQKKDRSSIGLQVGATLQDRVSWMQHYHWRLDPATPGRFPSNWPELLVNESNRSHIQNVYAGSLFGWIRNWMGLEKVALLVYDDPDLFSEIVERIADCVFGMLEPALKAGFQPDFAHFWEDMAYNHGPMLSPRIVQQFLCPHYKRITDLLRQYGVDIIALDCDGLIDALIPCWLDAGINTIFPLEVGTWQTDPVQLRARFGPELRMIGGFDKRILALSKDAISAEIDRLAPLVEQGGYLPCPDHNVPPDVSLDNFMFYIERARRVWCREINLPPVGLESQTPSARQLRRSTTVGQLLRP
ncbi:MAG: hypothetical protein JW829_15310 [Pirellulales bacterium]|nr:hypothetical protein [Pirellulales bacterium]